MNYKTFSAEATNYSKKSACPLKPYDKCNDYDGSVKLDISCTLVQVVSGD